MTEFNLTPTTKKVIYGISGAIVLYALIGFFLIPAVLKNQLPKITKENLNRTSEIKKIYFNPFSMELELSEFNLKNADDALDFVSFDRLYFNLGVISSIFNLAPTIQEFSLEKPNTLIQRKKDGLFNFSDLLTKEEPEKEEEPSDGELFPVIVEAIKMSEGKVIWEDYIPATVKHEEIFPLNLEINNFTTQVNAESKHDFSLAILSGGHLDWSGYFKVSPLESKGELQLNDINFNKVWQLALQETVNFKIQKGSERIKLDYELKETEKGIQVLINNAQANLLDVQISPKNDDKTVINIPDFQISGINVDLLKQQVKVAQISGNNAAFDTWLDKQGVFSYQTLFAGSSSDSDHSQQPTPPQDESTEEESQPWLITTDEIKLSDLEFNFTDNTLTTPAKLNLSSLNLSASDFNSTPESTLPIDLAVIVNKTGKLNISGSTVLQPFSSDLNIKVNGVALNDFQPYIDESLNLDLVSGLLNTELGISIAQKENTPLDLKINGNTSIVDLITRDQIAKKDFVNWKSLDLSKIDLDIAENRYNIDTVKLDQLYSRVLIRKNKTINVSDIVKQSNSPKKEESKEEPTSDQNAKKPSFKIAHFYINNGTSDFSDKSLIIPFAAHIKKLTGEVKGISSEKNARIDVDLNGRVANIAPVKIKGDIAPESGDSTIDLNFNSMPMPIMTPYMAEFAGRKIEKGNMSLALKYSISNRQLKASNNLLIDQLTLGESVDNPDAVSLPLDLAIALLEDSSGKIKLDMPVTGSLDDPQFSVGGLIFDTLVNVLTKIVASPFNAIASVVGSDEDISQISFAAGETQLNNDQVEKLKALATALKERPALTLEIQGASFTKEDWPLLKYDALNDHLLNVRAEQLSKESKETVLPEHLKYSEEENQRIMADLFIEQFPEQGKRSMFGTPKLITPGQEEMDFYQVAREKLADQIKAQPDRLEELASARAQAIAKVLTENEIAVERMFLLSPAVKEATEEGTVSSALNLSVK